VIAFDRFGDVDLRAVAPGATAPSSEALAALGTGIGADAVVYGAGFENRPDLVRALAQGRELLGTPPELLAAVRDPWAVGAAARAAGAHAPETRSAVVVPNTGDPWLRKPRQGGGGRGVRRWSGGRLGPTEILQRCVRGLPNAELAGLEDQLRAVCDEVAARFGVRGAFGIDAVWDGRRAWVLEVNPRPPAGLELFGPGCFEAHVRGARGLGLPAPGAPPATTCAKVKLVLFADRDLRAPDPEWWQVDLVRDIPHAGETIRRGAPVCTLVSASADPAELAARGARLLASLPEAVLAGG